MFEPHFVPFFKHSIMKTIERPTSLLASTGFSSVALLYVCGRRSVALSRFTAPTQPVSWWPTVKLHGLLACVPRGWAAEAESSFEHWTARAFKAVHMLAPQLLSSMNLRRMRRASFFLSLLPFTWFVLLFCCGAMSMSLSALLSSKDERDKLIVARTPKKTVQATGFWSRSFQKYALESKNVPDLLALSKEKIGEE